MPEETGTGGSTEGVARERIPSIFRAIRPTLAFLVLLLALSTVAYPGLVREVAKLATPHTANGSILTFPNGTAYGSSLLGQNVTNPALFWLRPSLIDYQAFTGAGGEVPYGPTNPALLNLTQYYISVYGLNNTTVPIDLVAPSASGLDPDLYPEAVLVQIPRVALNSHLTQSWLMSFVTARVTQAAGFVGPQYINVVTLDRDLLAYLPAGATFAAAPAT